MTLKDISNGPDWALWVIIVLFAVLSLVLLSGHGAFLIAGYNTASKERKAKYDEKMLCRVTGMVLALITFLLLVMAIWQAVLPAWFAYVFLGVTLAGCFAAIVMSNTICKK